ncbi:ATP-binding protein [Amycolatopsis sp. H20-H5]|uniref:ATP-binding protein n=1 Tax=Amycolatopsis sp. H20-H5 TaxID=3046309 RepID=UPI002DBB2DAF|nr:ATP-binding protein [Amycolatopsis sp. H20-H5]MEC3976708.1 ATP-binding protein [Amycolatopsis sp. H20-H5]
MDPSTNGHSGGSGGGPRSPETLDAQIELSRLEPGHIELRVPAEANQLSLVRLLVQGIAARADFDLDAIDDTVMAVDEACACLLDHTEPGLPLVCRFTDLEGELRISVSASLSHGTEPSTQRFGWHVLGTLTDSVSMRILPTEIGGHPEARIEFAKRPAGVRE